MRAVKGLTHELPAEDPLMVEVQIVDADVHPRPRSSTELKPYLPAKLRSLSSLLDSRTLYVPATGSGRADARPPDGSPPGSDPEFMQRQLLTDAKADYAILNPLLTRPHPNPAYEAALASASNDWLNDTWLSKYNDHQRYRGTVSLCAAAPQVAVAEIERWADNPMMVQVWLNALSPVPYGDPFYRPILRAAAEHNLPVSLHVARGAGTTMLTPVGFVSYYFEQHGLYPLSYAAHLVSLICSGALDELPTLKIVFVEGGFGWLLPVIWHLEKQWDHLHSEIPWAQRRPWEYVQDHCRFTSQPIEEPPNLKYIPRVFELADAEHLLLFSTDYPHWDYDDPKVVWNRLRPNVRQRVFRENAIELYGLPRMRPSTAVALRASN